MASADDCDKKMFYSPSKPVGGVKPIIPCNPVDKKLPQELKEPEDTVPPKPHNKIPRAIVLNNRPTQAFCELDIIDSDGYPSTGHPVMLPAGTLTEVITIQTIASIPTSVLNYISINNLEDELESLFNTRVTSEVVQGGVTSWPSVATTADLERLAGIQPGYGEMLLTLVNAKLKELDEAAKTLAISQLDCVWWNAAQTAECPDPEMADYTQHADAVFSMTVPANTISSQISQSVANDLALSQAQSGLNCFYVSDAVTADCVTRPNAPRPNMEWVPNDGPDDPEPHRVGFVVIPAGAYISMTGKAQATEFAQQIAYSMLNCFYKSDPIDIECEDPNARNTGVDPETSDPVEVNLIVGGPASAEVPGQHIIMQQGYFISQLSTIEANFQARQLAESLLTCCFISRAIHRECDPEASRKYSPVWSYSLIKGAFNSCESQEDADWQANVASEGMIQCVYCNKVVPPECVPDWIVAASTDGILITGTDFTVQGKTWKVGDLYKIELPLNPIGLINPFTREPEDFTTWSIDATSGVAPETLCANTKEEAKSISEMLNATLTDPSTGIPSCRYKSTRLLAGCGFADPYVAEPIGIIMEGIDSTYTAVPALYNGYASAPIPFVEPAEILYYATYVNTLEIPDLSAMATLQAEDLEVDASLMDALSEELGSITVIPVLQPSIMPELYRVYQARPTNAISARLSMPTPGTFIEFPEGFMTASAADIPDADLPADLTNDEARKAVRDYLDGMVLEVAKGMIECMYKNPVTYVACAWAKAGRFPSFYDQQYAPNGWYGDVGAAAWWIGEDKTEPEDRMAPGGAKVSDPIVIPDSTFIGDTYEVVRDQVYTLGSSLLNCRYMNDEQECEDGCPPPGVDKYTYNNLSQGSTMIIPENVVIADTVAEANAIAKTMLSCPKMCLYGNTPVLCDCGEVIPENTFISPDWTDIQAMNDMMCDVLCMQIQVQIFGNGAMKCSDMPTLMISLEPGACNADWEGVPNCWENEIEAIDVEPIALYEDGIPEDLFTSTVSQKDANDMAAEFLKSVCDIKMYTNASEIVSLCHIHTTCIPCLSSDVEIELRRPSHYRQADSPESLEEMIHTDLCADCHMMFMSMYQSCLMLPENERLQEEVAALNVLAPAYSTVAELGVNVPTYATTKLNTVKEITTATLQTESINVITDMQEHQVLDADAAVNTTLVDDVTVSRGSVEATAVVSAPTVTKSPLNLSGTVQTNEVEVVTGVAPAFANLEIYSWEHANQLDAEDDPTSPRKRSDCALISLPTYFDPGYVLPEDPPTYSENTTMNPTRAGVKDGDDSSAEYRFINIVFYLCAKPTAFDVTTATISTLAASDVVIDGTPEEVVTDVAATSATAMVTLEAVTNVTVSKQTVSTLDTNAEPLTVQVITSQEEKTVLLPPTTTTAFMDVVTNVTMEEEEDVFGIVRPGTETGEITLLGSTSAEDLFVLPGSTTVMTGLYWNQQLMTAEGEAGLMSHASDAQEVEFLRYPDAPPTT